MDLVGEQDECAEDRPREQAALRTSCSAVVIEPRPDPAKEGDDREDQIDAVGDAEKQPGDGTENRRHDRDQGGLDGGRPLDKQR